MRTFTNKKVLFAKGERGKPMAEIKQDREAWTEGYQAPRGAVCPYEAGTDKALFWASGHVEGLARKAGKS